MIRIFFTRQFFRFLVAGGAAAASNWFSRIFFGRWLEFSWAVAGAYVVGMSVAFILNIFFVFPFSKLPRSRQAFQFFLVNAASFPIVWISSILLNGWLIRMGVHWFNEEISHGLAIAVPVLSSYLIYKKVTFKDVG